MKKLMIALAALLGMTILAQAQEYTDSNGKPIGAFVPIGGCPLGGGKCAGAAVGVPVQTQTPTTIFVKRVVTTGTPINLPSNVLVNGLIGTTTTANAGNVYYGPSSASVAAIDGTGDGYPILPGASVSESLTNSNAIWVNGASGLVIYFKGN